MELEDLNEEALQSLYSWVDGIPLSRPKRNIARDFSDAVLAAEIVYHYFPREVQLHNYSPANSFVQKMYNWNTLNSKVCSRLDIPIPRHLCEAAARAKPLAIESILAMFRRGFAEIRSGYSTAAPLIETNPGHAAQEEACNASQEAQVTEKTARSLCLPETARLHSRPDKPQHKSALKVHSLHSAEAELKEKQETIKELEEINDILETKTRKLEQLVRLKDAKIDTLLTKLQAAGLTSNA